MNQYQTPQELVLGEPDAPDTEGLPEQFSGSTVRVNDYPRLVGAYPSNLACDDTGALRPLTSAEIQAGIS